MAFSLFSTPQQTSSPFAQPQQQQSSPFWPQQQQQQSLFQPPQQSQPQQFQLLQQQQQQQQQQHLYLFTTEKAPASYGTKWADLHPDSQKILLQIEEKILEHRDESQRLDQCSRLYDSSVSSDGFEHDASHIIQELGGTTTAMERQKALLQELMTSVKEMLRNTEMAIRSFMILRQRFALSNPGTTSNPTAPSQTPGTASHQAAITVVPVFDFYNGLPKKPSPFLQQTVARFEKYLVMCRQWVEELEQILLLDSDRNGTGFGSSLVESLPRVMSNVHDFFVHVAAKVESIHQYIESMKSAYLADQRRRGDGSDPFIEADRRETARQEAATKRAHPTLHLPAVPQPSTQISGLLTGSSAPAMSGSSQSSGAALSATSGSGFFSSIFSTPAASSPAMPSSLFSTPSTSAPVSSLFGTMAGGAATPQTSLFSAPSSSLFGTASVPSPFGTTAPSFGSATQTGSSIFSTPFASGSATGSGASFGTTKSTRPKSRTARR
ncbi:hypothetical protein MLD38_028606 [Melastoma candidum]|uniref:Uncharacterized protein n=1 Tax=Melastoma candidum TaxID=119954 RepID=A0ACB9N1L3_9MYRT|nr:hypothetical protein MLD38_028606 [Melastoma candidum]